MNKKSIEKIAEELEAIIVNPSNLRDAFGGYKKSPLSYKPIEWNSGEGGNCSRINVRKLYLLNSDGGLLIEVKCVEGWSNSVNGSGWHGQRDSVEEAWDRVNFAEYLLIHHQKYVHWYPTCYGGQLEESCDEVQIDKKYIASLNFLSLAGNDIINF